MQDVYGMYMSDLSQIKYRAVAVTYPIRTICLTITSNILYMEYMPGDHICAPLNLISSKFLKSVQRILSYYRTQG